MTNTATAPASPSITPINVDPLGDPPTARAAVDSPAPRRTGRPRLSDEEKAARKAEREARASTDERAAMGSVSPRSPGAQSPKGAALPIAVDYGSLGEQAADMFFFVGQIAVGDDWIPDTEKGEHTAVAGAFTSYFRVKQMPQLDPGYALVVVLFAYGAKRMQRETFRARVSKGLSWVKSKVTTR